MKIRRKRKIEVEKERKKKKENKKEYNSVDSGIVFIQEIFTRWLLSVLNGTKIKKIGLI